MHIYMNKYYPIQFRKIQDLLRYDDATDIISGVNEIRQQLIGLQERHGIDVDSFPQLSMDDFWFVEEDE